jgi:hypothetical protein
MSATLTGWLGSAHSRGAKRFLPARAESQSALLHARTREGYLGYSGYSGYWGYWGYSGVRRVHRHTDECTRGCEEVLGSLGLRASKAWANKTARFLCALETTFSNQDSLFSTGLAWSHTAQPVRARSNQWIPNTPHLGLTLGSIRTKSSMANCTLGGTDGGTYVCGSAETDAATACCDLVGVRARH